ncbi:hypothetical protein EDD28_1658 [Salana multivorans]|uniref:FtsX-like permease family protein n=1 Tax=Salana multivorans TaxID=120377 RepID=A0A3N2DB82_9MICO|nr:hypothetical protein [Salana multivorans]ROR97065.1 hypothetical protein EDD28_1658 [Salana multivorans]
MPSRRLRLSRDVLARLGEPFRLGAAGKSWSRQLAVWGTASLLVLGALVLWQVRATLHHEYLASLDSGGNLVVLSGADGSGGVDAALCQEVRGWSVVMETGSVRRLGIYQVEQAPGTSLQVAEVDTQLVTVLASSRVEVRGEPSADAPAVLVGSSVVEVLGVGSGELSLRGIGPVNVVGAYSFAATTDTMERWILIPTAVSGPSDECWIQAREGWRGDLLDLLGQRLAGSSVDVTTVRSASPEESVDGALVVLDAWGLRALMLALGLLQAGLVVRVARPELALLRILGFGPLDRAAYLGARALRGLVIGLGVVSSAWLPLLVLTGAVDIAATYLSCCALVAGVGCWVLLLVLLGGMVAGRRTFFAIREI